MDVVTHPLELNHMFIFALAFEGLFLCFILYYFIPHSVPYCIQNEMEGSLHHDVGSGSCILKIMNLGYAHHQ